MYRKIIIETFHGSYGSSSDAPPARPVPGQGLNTALNVECSGSMRRKYPIGTRFLISAKLTDREGTKFLYSHYSWGYKVLSTADVEQILSGEMLK